MNIPAEFFRRYAGNLNSLNTDMQIHSADYYTNAVKVLYTCPWGVRVTSVEPNHQGDGADGAFR